MRIKMNPKMKRRRTQIKKLSDYLHEDQKVLSKRVHWMDKNIIKVDSFLFHVPVKGEVVKLGVAC